jgi:membrane-associated phospholipid phosphatase
MPPVDFARWTTTLTASYLAITAALIAVRGNGVPGRAWLVAGHLALFAALLILNRTRPSAGIVRVIRDWHPLMLFPLLYKEVELLAAVIGDWRLTTAIPAWESALFAGQPSLYLSERLAFVPLSEYLHFCYLSYVIVIPSVTAYWYVSGRRAAFGELLLLLSTVLLGSYLFFILLPVDSPYYLSQRLGPPLSGHFFFDLVHQMSALGGARGGAFPSAHVSGAVVVSLVAWRHQRRLAYLLVPVTGSVMIATVYGRFHYVLDTLAGAGLAIAIVAGYRFLSGGVPGEAQAARDTAIASGVYPLR